ncbi:MAG: phosphatidylglycerophosphatase A [Gammaproteobacteria bacterium]|nr:phosphatidylglycerophosphatase A [Gammaproteobacteria bacterium]
MGSQSMTETLRYWIAVGFGSGLTRKAPGTFGTVGAIPLVWWGLSWTPTTQGVVLIALCLAALWSIPEGGRRLGATDHGCIVIDEWAGFAVAAWGLSAVTMLSPLGLLVLSFVGFRVFDIAKPWPVSWAERAIPGAFGVLADDLVAGLYVLLIGWLSAMIWPL